MAENEKELITTMAEAVPQLNDSQKSFIEGYIAGAINKKKGEKCEG